MPPGDLSSLYTRNRFMGEIEQPTQAGGMTAPQFGGSPEQLMQILQHPAVQQGLQQFLGQGYHFDPSQIRQSPFLPQQFMQHHPMMGGMMNNAMANVAATPDAPMVSGAGSGMSRAMQGAAGGPEMLRQYQIRQMLAPMQAAGGMMPMQEFQRKQQLLQLLQRGEEHGEQMSEAEEGRRVQADKDKARLGQEKLESTHDYFPPGVPGVYQPYVPGKPQMDMQTGIGGQGGGAGLISPGQGPHYGPPQAIGQQQIGGPQSGVAGVATAKETPATKAQKEGAGAQSRSKARLNDRTDPNRPRGGGGKPKDYAPEYDKVESDIRAKMQPLERAALTAKTPEERQLIQQQIETLKQERETRKGTIDTQRGDPGASKRGYNPQQAGGQQQPPQISPGARPQQQMPPGAPPPQGGPQQRPQTQNFNPQEINSHPEMRGKPAGRYKDNQTGAEFTWDGQQVRP